MKRIKVSKKPIKVDFYKKDGTPIKFDATQTVTKSLKVRFYKKK